MTVTSQAAASSAALQDKLQVIDGDVRRSMPDYIPASCVCFRGKHEDPTSWHAPSLEHQDPEDQIRIAARLLSSVEDFEQFFESEDGDYGFRLYYTSDTSNAKAIASRIGPRRLNEILADNDEFIPLEGGLVALDLDSTLDLFLGTTPDEVIIHEPNLDAMIEHAERYVLTADGDLVCTAPGADR